MATISRQGADGTGGYYVADLGACYNRDVSAYKRGIKLNRNTGVITVQDEFTPVAASSVYWIMHSPATDGLQISADGKTATLNKNGKIFYAVIAAPATARFEKVDRSETVINYLPESAAAFSSIMSGKNSANKWYGKLQIKLTDVAAGTPATIRVDFSASVTASFPALKDLVSWTTSN